MSYDARRDAFLAGQEAGRIGKIIEENPYPTGDATFDEELYFAWRRGWDSVVEDHEDGENE